MPHLSQDDTRTEPGAGNVSDDVNATWPPLPGARLSGSCGKGVMRPSVRRALVIAVLFFPGWLGAGEVTEQVKSTSDRILAVVADPDMKGDDKAEERRQRVRQEIDGRFDWERMAVQALGARWDSVAAAEKAEFLTVFSALLERTYMNKIEGYAGEVIKYVGETAAGADGVATVNVTILTTKQTEIPVDYLLRREAAGWKVVDILIEKVSLVQNYRSQFSAILAKKTFPEMMTILKKKIEARK